MRLIDADAVKAKSHNFYPSIDHYCCSVKAVSLKDIDNAPTIDAVPVVRGEWLPAKDPYDRVYCYRHAGCGCEHNEQSTFCPACGAKMEDKT